MLKLEIRGKQLEPVTISRMRGCLMAQVEERTAGLCKEIPHLMVQRQQQPVCSDEEGAQRGRTGKKIRISFCPSGGLSQPMRQCHSSGFVTVSITLTWQESYDLNNNLFGLIKQEKGCISWMVFLNIDLWMNRGNSLDKCSSLSSSQSTTENSFCSQKMNVTVIH